MGAIDVFDGAGLKTFGEAIVFFAAHVAVGFVEELNRAVQAAGPIETRIDGDVIVDVFAVVDRSLFDFKDGSVDFFDSFAFLFSALATIGTFEVGARIAQIGQSMQICGVLATRSSRSGGYCGVDRREQYRSQRCDCEFRQALNLFDSPKVSF